jgi:hypothetical protein
VASRPISAATASAVRSRSCRSDHLELVRAEPHPVDDSLLHPGLDRRDPSVELVEDGDGPRPQLGLAEQGRDTGGTAQEPVGVRDVLTRLAERLRELSTGEGLDRGTQRFGDLRCGGDRPARRAPEDGHDPAHAQRG